MCTQFQPMRFNVGSDGILLLAQSDITSLVLLPLLLKHMMHLQFYAAVVNV